MNIYITTYDKFIFFLKKINYLNICNIKYFFNIYINKKKLISNLLKIWINLFLILIILDISLRVHRNYYIEKIPVWSWDYTECFSLMSWLFYLFIIHFIKLGYWTLSKIILCYIFIVPILIIYIYCIYYGILISNYGNIGPYGEGFIISIIFQIISLIQIIIFLNIIYNCFKKFFIYKKSLVLNCIIIIIIIILIFIGSLISEGNKISIFIINIIILLSWLSLNLYIYKFENNNFFYFLLSLIISIYIIWKILCTKKTVIPLFVINYYGILSIKYFNKFYFKTNNITNNIVAEIAHLIFTFFFVNVYIFFLNFKNLPFSKYYLLHYCKVSMSNIYETKIFKLNRFSHFKIFCKIFVCKISLILPNTELCKLGIILLNLLNLFIFIRNIFLYL